MKRFKYILTLSLLLAATMAGRAQSVTNALSGESWLVISNHWGGVALAQTTRAAAGGEVTAQFYLGSAYFNGDGVATNEVESLKWMRLAADQGLARAQFYLGHWYENGDAGLPQDYEQAAKYYRLAADQGHALAQNDLGWLYVQGEGVPQDPVTAIKWYRLAAGQGNDLGEANLGWMYSQGQGVEKNYDLADKWMRQAAAQGSARLQYNYATMLEQQIDRNGVQVANFPQAAEWLRKAADQGYDKAEVELAELYNTGKLGDDRDHRAQCIPWYLKAAAQGNTDAQSAVGELATYYPGNPLLKSVNAVETQRQAAENGDFQAQFGLAKRYQTGDGVPADAAQAFTWMQKAAQNTTSADSGQGDAMYRLAVMYEQGEGVPPDRSAARELYLQAATVYALPAAALRAGEMYEKGEGVPPDDRRAVEFYANEFHVHFATNDPTLLHPEKYPHGVINYLDPGQPGAENALRLWSQGRGLPDDQDKLMAGYRSPGDLIVFWKNYLTTSSAEFYAGEIYDQGKVVPQDPARAADWFKQAAAQGSLPAMNRIGEMWAAGLNGAPDPGEAVNWYRRAAEKGLADAQFNLGKCFAQGQGVTLDDVAAWQWFQLAAEQKFPGAAEGRDQLRASMTDSQLKEARARVDQFKAAGQR
jgi:hypothetical protein